MAFGRFEESSLVINLADVAFACTIKAFDSAWFKVGFASLDSFAYTIEGEAQSPKEFA